MSANNTNKIYLAPKAKLYVSDVTAAAADLPDDLTTPLSATWKELGYTDEGGIELTPKIDTDPIRAHQSATALKYVLKDASMTLKFTCMQWDTDTVQLYFGASLVTTGGVSKLVIESTPALAEKALCVEWGDYTQDDVAVPPTITGTKSRFVVQRGMVSDKDAIKLTRTDVQALGITFDALDSDGQLGYILTNASA